MSPRLTRTTMGLFVAVVLCFCPTLLQAQTKPELDRALKPYQRSGEKLAEKINIGTSDTLGRLMDLWAHGFRHHHNSVNITSELIVDPDAADAFTKGVLPVIDGANLVALSWPMRNTELQEVKARMGAEPIEFAVALDAIVLVVHHRNPLPGLTMPQVAAIFGQVPHGAVETWEEAGLNGKIGTLAINCYGRDTASGTFAAFKKMGLNGIGQRADVRAQPGSMSVILEVGSDPAGIGYAATGFAHRSSKVRVVPLAKKEGESFITPTNETVLNGEYPLRRTMYIYAMPGQDGLLDHTTKAFISYVLSRDGQHVAKEDGFFPLPANMTEQALKKLESNGRVAAR
jgi:phosphate transport system substrate-binding protein